MATTVFVSAGTPADDAQQAFRDAVVRAAETAGLGTRLMTDRDWDYRNPLRGLKRAMEGCSGAIVVAYTRYEFDSGTELRSGEVRDLGKTAFPTAWNQIEAAMAYERGLPLLVVAQDGLRQDAMFESSGDIRPFWTPLHPDACETDGFLGYLHSWRDDVYAYAKRSAEEFAGPDRKITVRDLVTSLSWHEGLALLLSIVGMLAAAATCGYRVGRGEWPFG